MSKRTGVSPLGIASRIGRLILMAAPFVGLTWLLNGNGMHAAAIIVASIGALSFGILFGAIAMGLLIHHRRRSA